MGSLAVGGQFDIFNQNASGFCPAVSQMSSHRLLSLSQGSHCVAQFSIDLRILTFESGWNESESIDIFFD